MSGRADPLLIPPALATEHVGKAAGDGRPSAVTTVGLSKRYGRRLAVDTLSLEVPAGVVAGFIGPNSDIQLLPV